MTALVILLFLCLLAMSAFAVKQVFDIIDLEQTKNLEIAAHKTEVDDLTEANLSLYKHIEELNLRLDKKIKKVKKLKSKLK